MKLKPRTIELKVPLLSGAESLMTVKRWLATVGAQVEIDQELVEIAIDDEPFLLPSPLDGKLVEIVAEAEEAVEPGQILALLEMD